MKPVSDNDLFVISFSPYTATMIDVMAMAEELMECRAKEKTLTEAPTVNGKQGASQSESLRAQGV